MFWGRGGGVLCTYISPKGVCDGGVKNGGWGRESGQKVTPSGQKETPSGQKVRKVGKSALELGKKKSIIIDRLTVRQVALEHQRQNGLVPSDTARWRTAP